jgi:hypothetical protein
LYNSSIIFSCSSTCGSFFFEKTSVTFSSNRFFHWMI